MAGNGAEPLQVQPKGGLGLDGSGCSGRRYPGAIPAAAQRQREHGRRDKVTREGGHDPQREAEEREAIGGSERWRDSRPPESHRGSHAGGSTGPEPVVDPALEQERKQAGTPRPDCRAGASQGEKAQRRLSKEQQPPY